MKREKLIFCAYIFGINVLNMYGRKREVTYEIEGDNGCGCNCSHGVVVHPYTDDDCTGTDFAVKYDSGCRTDG